MLFWVRVLSALVGAATAANVALGLMTQPEFIVADYLLAAFLILAALIPPPRAAQIALIGANAYALGVFTVAMAQRMELDGTLTPGLAAAAVLSAACLLFLLLRKDGAP